MNHYSPSRCSNMNEESWCLMFLHKNLFSTSQQWNCFQTCTAAVSMVCNLPEHRVLLKSNNMHVRINEVIMLQPVCVNWTCSLSFIVACFNPFFCFHLLRLLYQWLLSVDTGTSYVTVSVCVCEYVCYLWRSLLRSDVVNEEKSHFVLWSASWQTHIDTQFIQLVLSVWHMLAEYKQLKWKWSLLYDI